MISVLVLYYYYYYYYYFRTVELIILTDVFAVKPEKRLKRDVIMLKR